MMSKFSVLCSITILFVVIISCVGTRRKTKIDSDYYFGNMVVRAGRLEVECAVKNKEACSLKCGPSPSECFDNKCVCISAITSQAHLELNLEKKDAVEKTDAVEKYKQPPKKNTVVKDKQPPNLPLELLGPPVLRHHIAHFCPNLDIARKCIRKCMLKGKPAFCGKDHVCYCSHKVHPNKMNDNINITDTYTQFKDMYIKYFGPGIFEAKPTTTTSKSPKKQKKEVNEEDEEDEEEEEEEHKDEEDGEGNTEKDGEEVTEGGEGGEVTEEPVTQSEERRRKLILGYY